MYIINDHNSVFLRLTRVQSWWQSTPIRSNRSTGTEKNRIHQPFENNITNSHLVIWTSSGSECLNWLPLIKSYWNISGPSNLHDGADQALQAKLDFRMLMWKVKWETESSTKNPILWKSQGQKDWRASTPCFCHRRQLLHSHEKDSVSIKHT